MAGTGLLWIVFVTLFNYRTGENVIGWHNCIKGVVYFSSLHYKAWRSTSTTHYWVKWRQVRRRGYSAFMCLFQIQEFRIKFGKCRFQYFVEKIIFTYSFINIGFLTTMPFCACASVCDFGQREEREREKKNLMSNSLIFKCTTCVHIPSSFKIKSSTRSGELFPCSESRCDGQI